MYDTMLREIEAWRRLLQIKLWVLRKGRECRNSLVPYFEGKSGIEIGGPSLIFEKRGILPLYDVIECLDGCNYSEYTQWSNISKGNNYNFSRNGGYQYISEATDLKIISDKKYQFLLASHCLEHIANPIKALKEWIRITNGPLLIIVPNHEYTFDHKRPVTTLDHLISDYKNNICENDLSHLDEILKLHDLKMDLAAEDLDFFEKRSYDNYLNRCLHHHVFDQKLMKELFNYVELKVIKADLAPPYHIIFLIK